MGKFLVGVLAGAAMACAMAVLSAPSPVVKAAAVPVSATLKATCMSDGTIQVALDAKP